MAVVASLPSKCEISMRIWIGIIPALIIAHLTATALFGSTGQGLAQMWELSPIQAVWLQTAFMLAYAVRIPIGVFAANIMRDQRVFMLAFLVSILASGLFYFYADDFVSALILRLIAGGAAGAMVYPAMNMVTRNGAGGSIGLGAVILLAWSASVYVAQMAATVNLGTVHPIFPPGGGWNTIYVLLGVLGLIWLIPAYFLIPRKQQG